MQYLTLEEYQEQNLKHMEMEKKKKYIYKHNIVKY